MSQRQPLDMFRLRTNRFNRFCRFLTKMYHNYNHSDLRIFSTPSVEKHKNLKQRFGNWNCFRNALFNLSFFFFLIFSTVRYVESPKSVWPYSTSYCLMQLMICKYRQILLNIKILTTNNNFNIKGLCECIRKKHEISWK